MKKNVLIIALMFFAVIATNAQTPILKSGIKLENIGKIKTLKASEIKESYLGIGCEVLDRDFVNYDSYKEYLGDLGVKHARFQSGWAKTEKQKGVYDFAWLDTVIDDCRGRSIQPWINIVYGNSIYGGGGDMQSSSSIPTSEVALQAWDKYVRTLVNHFRTRNFEWEIWNEIDHHIYKGSTAEEYAVFFIRTAEVIREVQPEGKIIALALTFPGATEFVRGFLDSMKEKGKLHLIDKVSFHGYPKNPDADLKKTQELIDLLKQYDERIVAFQGETGCPSTEADWKRPYTELTQAKWDLRRALSHIGRGIRFSLFTISDFSYLGDKLNTKGKLKVDKNMNVVYAKQSYYAYQNLTSLFDSSLKATDPEALSIKVDSNSVVYAFVGENNNLSVVAYWNSKNPPSKSLATRDFLLTIQRAKIKSPVLVDVRTGMVYQLPESNIKNVGKGVEYKVPVYDSPMILCGKEFLEKRGLLKFD
ncbi:MAG: hypothetical protein L3J39_15925 [Verrucomicrobiales bacterium]|nr:hypothetical protein [Verrucomicrobiales bacterium]